MKIKNSNLEWYVLQWDHNQNKVKNVNILAGLAENIAKEVRSGSIYDKSIFREYLKTEFIYNYYNRAECEFFVSDLSGMNYEKIDIWRQIEPNFDRIIDYVNSKMDLQLK